MAAQAPPPGVDPFLGWLIAMAVSMISAAFAAMWWALRGESKRKDELIDRLMDVGGKATDVAEKTVEYAERRDRNRRMLR